MISKELLKAVYEGNVHLVEVEGKLLTLSDRDCRPPLFRVNIHELAHTCKEWADRQYWLITSTVRLNGKATASAHTKTHGHYEQFSASTEPEAIFKACQWILDNK